MPVGCGRRGWPFWCVCLYVWVGACMHYEDFEDVCKTIDVCSCICVCVSVHTCYAHAVEVKSQDTAQGRFWHWTDDLCECIKVTWNALLSSFWIFISLRDPVYSVCHLTYSSVSAQMFSSSGWVNQQRQVMLRTPFEEASEWELQK